MFSFWIVGIVVCSFLSQFCSREDVLHELWKAIKVLETKLWRVLAIYGDKETKRCKRFLQLMMLWRCVVLIRRSLNEFRCDSGWIWRFSASSQAWPNHHRHDDGVDKIRRAGNDCHGQDEWYFFYIKIHPKMRFFTTYLIVNSFSINIDLMFMTSVI